MTAWSPSESWWVRGVLAVGVLVVVITEGLGALGLIAPLPVAVCWAMVIGGSLLWHHRRTGRWLPAAPATVPVSHLHPAWWVIGVFLAVTFLIGIASAPNSWDAMTYHLPRIERWVEQGHLGFWPTSVDRQLWMSPWAGYFGLQFRLLTGGDAIAFLPSWLAYLGCILLTAAVVRQLRGDSGAQAWGALIMATVPPAVLQASAVQTDLIVGFWILVTLALVVEAWRDPARLEGWRLPLLLATATSLAFASKGTAALALAPWFVLLAVGLMRRRGYPALARLAVAGASVVLLLNLPHLTRTQRVFGSPLGASWSLDMLQLSPLTPGRVVGNVVANLSLHAGLPWEGWNTRLERAVLVTNEALGVDPAVQYRHYDGFRVNPFTTHESEAGMPVHMLLAVGLLGGMFVAVRRRTSPGDLLGFAVAGAAGFLLLLAVLRWQPYGARLQLAGLLWVPVLVPLVMRTARLRLAASVVLLVAALPVLLVATPRPLLGAQSVLTTTRSEQFARERPEHFAVVERTVIEAGQRQCGRIGLFTGWDQPEYFLSVVSRREGIPIRSEHFISTGPESRLTADGPTPDACILMLAEMLPGLDLSWVERHFRVIWADNLLAVLVRLPAAP